MTLKLISAWENSPKFRKLSPERKQELTRKLIYLQEHWQNIPQLVRYAAGFAGVGESSIYSVLRGSTFSERLLEHTHEFARRFLEEGISVRTPLPKKEELTGTALLLHYWGDDDEY